MLNTDLPRHLRKPILDLLAAGGCLARDGRMLIDGPPPFADALQGYTEQLAQHVVPSVSAHEAELVRSLLADAGASVAYIASPDESRRAVAEILAGDPDVIGLDFETEVLPRISPTDSYKIQKRWEPRHPTTPRWRGWCCALSISLQGATRPSMGGQRALLRI